MIERLTDMPAGTIGFRASGGRCALVTDVDCVSHAVGLMGWMMPGELHMFAPEELDQAKAWVAGH